MTTGAGHQLAHPLIDSARNISGHPVSSFRQKTLPPLTALRFETPRQIFQSLISLLTNVGLPVTLREQRFNLAALASQIGP
ncbi:hypothetical protein [Alloalcanivorax xenomutans]|uniref:hypothetical protein n=1 Tax=Alloalcanivorax xenomutans TaxID=1094342 RepID=UPI001F2CCE57|nr:hypothetical protein [Alloalcanivorax xenomutans]MCE7521951.1 hypothetical protein [Alloalcanivorax xenomutans]